MDFGQLLLPAVGGYWLLTRWNLTRYRTVRDSGHHLLLRVAGAGFLLLLIAHVSWSLLEWMFADFSIPDLAAVVGDLPQLPASNEVLLSLVLGILAPVPLNLIFRADRYARRAAHHYGRHVELTLDRALQEQSLAEVSLRNRRTYVGLVVESGVATPTATDAVLLPLYSGRRDPVTLRLIIDTDYRPELRSYLLQDMSLRMGGSDLTIAIPLNEIATVRTLGRLTTWISKEPDRKQRLERELPTDDYIVDPTLIAVAVLAVVIYILLLIRIPMLGD